MKVRHATFLAGFVLTSIAPVVGPAHAALSPWSQRVVELHAVLDAGALALAGSGEVIVSVTYEGPHYLVRTDHCTVLVNLATPDGAADEDTVPVPGPKQFSVHAESPVCD